MFKKEDEIKITRDEFLKKFMEVLSNPFEGADDIDIEDRASMQFGMSLIGILLMQKVETKLFGKRD